MLKFELLNIFLFQHPKDGLGEELNTNQICVIRGDQFFDKPEDGTEEYFVSEPHEFSYWDYWNAEQAGFSRNVFYGRNHLFGQSRFAEYKDLKLLSVILNSRLSLFEEQQKEAIVRIEQQQKEAIGRIEQKQKEAIERIEQQQKEIIGRIDGFEQRLLVCLLLIFYTQHENSRRIDEFEQRINRRIDDVEQRINRRIDDVEQRINRRIYKPAFDLITLHDGDIQDLRGVIGILGNRLIGLMDHLHLGNNVDAVGVGAVVEEGAVVEVGGEPIGEGGQEPDDEEQQGNGIIE
uniref:Uncharacterized protein n=1 Tax=Meloidogyne javanica TaxID=6303 RepID=A0A915LRR6_MELJA